MKKILIILLSLLIIPDFIFSQEDWVELFNGKNFDGWEIKQGNANFEILPNGEIVAKSILNSPSTYLGTKEKFENFILEFEVYADVGLNSGVQFRSLLSDKGSVYGYQCEIDTDESRSWTGGIYDQSRRGLFLYPLTRNTKANNAFKNGTWNKIRVEAIGQSIRTWVNGIHCSNLLDDSTSKGFIALQIHSIQKSENVGKMIKWRNIKILKSNLEAHKYKLESNVVEINNIDNYMSDYQKSKGWRFLWNGKTSIGWRGAKLDSFPNKGWKIDKGGVLKVLSSGGLESKAGGDIITERKFSNFELELDFKITKGANSGIKYFVDTNLNKGEGSAIGLEYQILDDKNHPDAKKGVFGNRTVASLYDLIPAENLQEPRGKRSVQPDTWHRARILVVGGKVEHWLDNIKMLEYDRFSQTFKSLVNYSKYKDWPGFGQLSSGHILLQDHGDEVSFKNIKIREF